MWDALTIFYGLGGALEVSGILLVVAEMRSDRRRALEVARISIPHVGHAPHEPWLKSPSWTIQGSAERDRQLAPQRAQAATSRELQKALIEILTGNRRIRVLGVWLLVVGVVVSTVANIIAT